MAEEAKKSYEDYEAAYRSSVGSLSNVHDFSLKWAQAGATISRGKPEAISAFELHLERMRKCQKALRAWDKALRTDFAASDYYVLEAERLVLIAKQESANARVKSPGQK
jgi:hypothetical protein